MGFCLLNNAAVAAEYARSSGVERVAILDWDVHHGNGTQDIFYANGGVLYLSVHQSPFYPGTGDACEVGEGRGRGFTVNVPLPGRSGEDIYAEAFAGFFIPILREYRPELLLVSAGYEAHSADLLGGMRLESASFGRFTARLAGPVPRGRGRASGVPARRRVQPGRPYRERHRHRCGDRGTNTRLGVLG
jgi:acetoin utilization deacetylase AcuC-like enzyme